MIRDLFEQITEDEAPTAKPITAAYEFELVLHYDNDKQRAVYVSSDGDENKAFWLPKSQIEMNPRGRDVRATRLDGAVITLPVVTVSMPEWLAKANHLI